MARPLTEIQAAMDEAQAAETDLATLNSPSTTAIYRLWKYIVSLIQYLFEVNMDRKIVEMEATVARTITPNREWLQQKVFEFQYDSITPQVIELIDFVPTYNPVDVTKRIITRASVYNVSPGLAAVKVAKSDPPVALSVPELAALQAYLTSDSAVGSLGTGGIGYAGVAISATSVTSDKMSIQAIIYYEGQYASVISATVIAALNAYMAALPFDGLVKVVDVVDAIQSVPGVNDVLIYDLALRANATAFGSRTKLINAQTQSLKSLATVAGYVIQETTGGETFTDKLTFTAI